MISLYLSMIEDGADKDKVLYIYENYYGYMSYCAEQILGDREEDIKDSVHNAMIKIIEHIDSIDITDKRRAKNYFGTITKNKAKDILKSKYARTVLMDELPDKKESVEDVFIEQVKYESLVASIFKLDEKYRGVLMLKYINDLKEKDISELLGISQKTVSTRISRGKKLLHNILKEESLNAK